MKRGCSTGLMLLCMYRVFIDRTQNCVVFFKFSSPNRDKIERSTLTGENRQIILHGVVYPYAMTVFQQDIFWTDWTKRAVFRARKDGGSGFAVLAQDLQYRPNDIHVYAGSKQELCSSSCQQFNGGCSHICVSGKSLHFTIIAQKKFSIKGVQNNFKKNM